MIAPRRRPPASPCAEATREGDVAMLQMLAANGASMPVEVTFPPVALDAETGRLTRWLAAEGERVREGQPLFEIEADPAATEFGAPASGVLRGLRAKAGDRLPVGATLAWAIDNTASRSLAELRPLSVVAAKAGAAIVLIREAVAEATAT